ncbi:hypothetical protein SK069_01170 [Patulibacter brassicae]|uniref:Uncharacterized protein n=1 Tax=Patulibacter brassicae TaxID=1705717 RepID=A0ABU4VEH9_9ACTN|nr:hypothetical protein [Patulibacter brassicae]MDX8150191.1 hypothetical protein [Patulibacter brassicae]
MSGLLAHIADPLHALLYLSPVAIVMGGLWLAGRHLPEEDESGHWADDITTPGGST